MTTAGAMHRIAPLRVAYLLDVVLQLGRGVRGQSSERGFLPKTVDEIILVVCAIKSHGIRQSYRNGHDVKRGCITYVSALEALPRLSTCGLRAGRSTLFLLYASLHETRLVK